MVTQIKGKLRRRLSFLHPHTFVPVTVGKVRKSIPCHIRSQSMRIIACMELLLVVTLTRSAQPFMGSTSWRCQWRQHSALDALPQSRYAFLECCSAFMLAVPSAGAKDVGDLKGTKKDPVFEGCMSTCMYECTKPKGIEQKSRAECIPECKQKCATSKAQLMIGTPIKKD
jgi:hypothetical protein